MINSKVMRNRRGAGSLIRIIVALIVIAAVGLVGWQIYSNYRGGTKADVVMDTLKQIVPGLGDDSGVSTGIGRDPLVAVSIEGLDIVGVLEVPALDIEAPVTSKDYREERFASWLDGSPVHGHFMVIGGKDDIFRRLPKLKPGDRVTFTDIDGVRYEYTVTTQYHLKKWDIGENEMQLCYETDSDTYFVVGCGVAQ